MQKMNEKHNANAVGATSSRPHFKEMTLNNKKGITLIALIITIIVMLILVGVTINVALNGGLFEKAETATRKTQKEVDKETLLSAAVAAIGTDGKLEPANIQLPDGWSEENGIYTSPKGNTYEVDENGKITEGENGGDEEAKKIEEALNKVAQASITQNEEELNAAIEELRKYEVSEVCESMDSNKFLKSILAFTSKSVEGEDEIAYTYFINKGYLYTSIIVDSSSEFKYVKPGTDKESEELLEKVLGLKAHLESKVVGQKVEDIRVKHDTNELEEYLLDGYEIDLYEIYMYDDGELALRTNDLFPNTSITAFSEDGETYSFVSTVTYN